MSDATDRVLVTAVETRATGLAYAETLRQAGDADSAVVIEELLRTVALLVELVVKQDRQIELLRRTRTRPAVH